MQNVMFRLSDTPGHIKWTGRNPGADNADVYGRLLGLDEQRMADLKARGVI
jgi:crotonobetainyl-CoA:carnitine CoA-transferase CaiB-like acyl-CoA transferase